MKLDVPILSIDYSLAPEAPFPRAVEEVFYAYCWALKNPEQIGWTGENVIVVGDSAGGNLVTSIVIQCIEREIRKPKGLFFIYTPHWVGFPVTPARFLSLIDPVLPFGFTSRLIKSYCDEPGSAERDNEKRASQGGKNKSSSPYATYEEEFDLKMKQSYLMSTYLAPDEILREFPPTQMLSTNLDICLDDGIEFAKKLRHLNVEVKVDIVTGLPHGFLYFTQVINFIEIF